MAVWQENLKRLLNQKEVLILHGNIRDTAYIKDDGSLIRGLTDLINSIGAELGYDRTVSWGTFFDHEERGHSPIWSLERITPLKGGQPDIRETESQDRVSDVLHRWLEDEVKSIDERTIFVINYIDKITGYCPDGMYSQDTAELVTIIQKIIENISENNRLIMVSLRDTMVPVEYYTNSPRVAVMEIPLPDKTERHLYYSTSLSLNNVQSDQIDLLSNITEGLYMKDLENILSDVLAEIDENGELSSSTLKKIVNRYRIGTEEDPWSRIPLIGPPKGLIDSAENWFLERVIGQDHAVREIVNAIKKARAGVVGLASGGQSKPKAAFFFAGPTGVGKTFLAKKLAEYLFDTEEAFLRFDMSEFKEEHTVSKLIGSPPGYIGYDEGGQLTKAIKNRPFSVILFDEIEKAHPKILDIFLQILDDGRLTDSRGQTVFFTESVIIFTSNIGTRTVDSRGNPVSEQNELDDIINDRSLSESERDRRVREHFTRAVREFFTHEISRRELLNRIGSHIIAFNYLDKANFQRGIIQSKLEDLSDNFRDKFSNKGYRLNFQEEVVDYFLKKHADSISEFGGRGLVNALEDEVGHILADQLLFAEDKGLRDIEFSVYVNGGAIECRRS
ncbi:ATP-dependent Clp protease ATP-binding subunit [Methanothermobacter sp. KEPCO-1]|uniref:AAA family ATPase n=1 Tax=Methanothermobacter sp. CaT2 TaxID=866790 RepID=UPI0002CCE64F|nr:AAA family ATPase [Methanothermobacter sp. CaT2]QEF93831.1 ATP-dependent Clp protease ATP-binding subunit [Methanothermobacter sp. KEPCO-1]BAM69501.1 ATP-dependent Clp protease regulatory subunit [Methanothermobacter sp. CaT2]